ncbi:MAG TPA: FAD-dependent oxidoreductase, partial [Pseudonocardiaceae bacterium]|nr:FAD-dependent oxidoreductase [Pseudonocardiaceae bacterium]
TVEEFLPGSAHVVSARELAATRGLHCQPAEAPVVAEQRAGHLSPAMLRSAVLSWLREHVVDVRVADVREVTATADVVLWDGTAARFDSVVVAAGAWTPALAADGHGLRTKRIQYAVYPGTVPGLGAFVDENSGLYGCVYDEKSLLLGRSTDEWDVSPSRVIVDPELAAGVGVAAAALFLLASAALVPTRMCTAADCYVVSGGLRLRPVPSTEQVFTFTGGSGGAAKTVLAASRQAADRLLDDQ